MIRVHIFGVAHTQQLTSLTALRLTQPLPTYTRSHHVAARLPTPAWRVHIMAATGVEDTNSTKFGAPSLRRALGIDYGRRQVGLAISTLGLAPRPLQFVNGARNLSEMTAVAQEIANIAAAEGTVLPRPGIMTASPHAIT
jgi:hypothetical protein